MEDSFFGFDTSAPVEDDGGGESREGGEEEEYDALNDETFGAAIKGDWENIHEKLVQLDGLNGTNNEEDEGSDLEINLSGVKLDDVDIGSDDNESRIQLDPSVWSTPIRPRLQQNLSNNGYSSPETFLRRHFPQPFDNVQHQNQSLQQQQQQQHQQQQHQQQQQQNRMFGLSASSSLPPKICTVEDIERNIRNQQMRTTTPKPTTPLPNVQPPISAPNNNAFSRPSVPPGFNPQRMNFNSPPQHPMSMHQPNQGGHRMPPGFPQMHMMGPHGLPGPPHHPNFQRNLSHNLPIALNNFAMHPNFNAMRPMGPPIVSPRLPVQHNLMQGMPGNAAVNQFNQRLVQEIQQNHPMLANNRGMNHPYNNSHGNHPHNQHNPLYQHVQKNYLKVNMRSNGNVEEFDEYSNLMSARDKHWLIGIQLSQLNTETPYIDDYYFTVLKERRAKLSGESQSRAHKDNQLNHPLIQPKGHAQLVLISMGRNGANIRNGQNRERKNSETKLDKEPVIRTYTPLQFENSLGKLQYGSVTAPRKIIDMDVMGSDSGSQFSTSVELSAQRKSKQLLLHIETVYRIVLKLEDLENPAALAAFAVVKERKEKEKQMALDQAMMLEITSNATNEQDKTDSVANSVNSTVGDKCFYEIESHDRLIQNLLPLIAADKVALMMSVRKGKALIRRIMPFIEDNPVRWEVWCGVFMSLQSVLKKDKTDGDGSLFALYPYFKKQIATADLNTIMKIANSFSLNEKRANILFTCKFCISSLVAVLLRVEEIYSLPDSDVASNEEWPQFLSMLSISLNKTVQHQTISAAIESNAIQPMVQHFSRFKELKLDSLMALFSPAKQTEH